MTEATQETFVQQAIRTESIPATLKVNGLTTNNALCLMRSIAGALDLIKKKMYYGKEIDKAEFQEFFEDATSRFAMLNDMVQAGAENEVKGFTDLARQVFEAKGASADEINKGIAAIEDSNTQLSLLADNYIREIHTAIGIFTESGELAECLLKALHEGGELDKVNFAEELGDVDWYKAIGHDVTGVSEDVIRAKIIAKLRKRYPEKFTSENALNRDLAAERAILEA